MKQMLSNILSRLFLLIWSEVQPGHRLLLPNTGWKGHTWLTVLRLSSNQLCSRRTIW